MSITVEAGGSLKARVAPHLALNDVQTVGQAIERLRLPPDVALIMLVNGRIAHWTTELQDGDVLQLLPTIGGGAISITTAR